MAGKEGKKQIAICKKSGDKVEKCEFHDFDSDKITDFRAAKYNLTCSKGGGEGGDDNAEADARKALDSSVGDGLEEQAERTAAKKEEARKRLDARKKTKKKQNNPEDEDDDPETAAAAAAAAQGNNDDDDDNPKEGGSDKDLSTEENEELGYFKTLTKEKVDDLTAMLEFIKDKNKMTGDDYANKEWIASGVNTEYAKKYIDISKSKPDTGLVFKENVVNQLKGKNLSSADKKLLGISEPAQGGRRRRRGGTKRRRKSKRRKSKRRKKSKKARKSKRRKSKRRKKSKKRRKSKRRR